MGSRLLPLLLVAIATDAGAATLLPLDAEDAVPLATGRLEAVLGGEGAGDEQPLFRRSEQDRWSAPFVAVNVGVGSRAEVQFRWEALSVDGERPDSRQRSREYGTGDARLFTKLRVTSEGAYGWPWLPASGVAFGVKLPNANRSRGLGTDEADVFGHVLVSRSFGGARAHANVGIGILGNPRPEGGQDDVVLYDLGLVSPPVRFRGVPFSLYGEVNGVGASRFGNDRSRLRLGIRFGGTALSFYLAGSRGLDDRSESWGVRFGIVTTFAAFAEGS
jgi:hypothetical protein